MASADNTSTLDIDKALDVTSRRMGYERLFPKQREAVEAFISGSDVAIRVFYRLATERASVSLSLSVHGLLPHRHTLGTEPTLLDDPMAHTQVLHTAGWSHIQLPLTCVDINMSN